MSVAMRMVRVRPMLVQRGLVAKAKERTSHTPHSNTPQHHPTEKKRERNEKEKEAI